MLIKVGTRYINLDQVTFIRDIAEEHGVADFGQPYTIPAKVCVDASDDGRQTFEGDEADALRAYLDTIAIDVQAPEHTDEGYQDFRKRDGHLNYADWLTISRQLEEYGTRSESWWLDADHQRDVADLERLLKH